MKVYKTTVKKHFPQGATLGEILMKISGLDIAAVTDAAHKGAVWLQRGGKGKILRTRNTQEKLRPDDLVTFNHDKRILSLTVKEAPVKIAETKHYGVWYKPAGMLTQGTQTGDHTSLLRLVQLEVKKEPYLVHRLDRETMGITVVAYTSEGARELSRLFNEDKMKKTYLAIVLGEIERGHRQTIDASLDGKEAITHFEVLANGRGRSLIRVQLETGRLHQIRRHLDFIGHPVMGDPKYGAGNKNKDGLKLLAKSLSFLDPWDKTLKNYECVQTFDGP